jgi:hypothetical protein
VKAGFDALKAATKGALIEQGDLVRIIELLDLEALPAQNLDAIQVNSVTCNEDNKNEDSNQKPKPVEEPVKKGKETNYWKKIQSAEPLMLSQILDFAVFEAARVFPLCSTMLINLRRRLLEDPNVELQVVKKGMVDVIDSKLDLILVLNAYFNNLSASDHAALSKLIEVKRKQVEVIKLVDVIAEYQMASGKVMKLNRSPSKSNMLSQWLESLMH